MRRSTLPPEHARGIICGAGPWFVSIEQHGQVGSRHLRAHAICNGKDRQAWNSSRRGEPRVLDGHPNFIGFLSSDHANPRIPLHKIAQVQTSFTGNTFLHLFLLRVFYLSAGPLAEGKLQR
jgi:hypothetical protein